MTRLVRAADSVAEGLIQRILCQTAVVVSSPLGFGGGSCFLDVFKDAQEYLCLPTKPVFSFSKFCMNLARQNVVMCVWGVGTRKGGRKDVLCRTAEVATSLVFYVFF